VVATYVARKAPDASATGPLSFGVQMPAYGWGIRQKKADRVWWPTSLRSCVLSVGCCGQVSMPFTQFPTRPSHRIAGHQCEACQKRA
jgi:hypothetical protein